jgi:hypothetical protein
MIASPAAIATIEANNKTGASCKNAFIVSTVACLCEIIARARRTQYRPISLPR